TGTDSFDDSNVGITHFLLHCLPHFGNVAALAGNRLVRRHPAHSRPGPQENLGRSVLAYHQRLHRGRTDLEAFSQMKLEAYTVEGSGGSCTPRKTRSGAALTRRGTMSL